MVKNRAEKRRARKISSALGCDYTRGLRIYRSEAFNYEIDWDTVDDEFLRSLFADHK